MIFAKTFKSLIGKFRGGSKNSIIVKTKALNNEYQSKNAFGPGIEINPAVGERIIITKIDNSDSYLVNIGGVSDNVSPDTNPGERRFFSVNSNGNLSAYTKLKNNGILELNGNNNFAVLYNELLEEFNKLNDKFNAHISTFNSHTHPYQDTPVGPSTTSVTLTTSSLSDADITNTKSDKVTLPNN
ncbi:MAG: hypothetical protein ACTSRG_13030 [Candidatus Helarchaeota archaeon]